MDPMCRKRNASDGDSGFDSALSSRSSSISLDQESPEFGKHFFSPPGDLLTSKLSSTLRSAFQDILHEDEDIDREDEDLLLITNKVTGAETLYKPPSRLRFSTSPPEVAATHSPDDYDRNNAIPRNHLFHARLEYELEKQIDKMDLVEVDLVMDSSLSPPPSLGIRVIGVNMIHGVPDKLNIYVKRVVEESVAGLDGRIRVNDHIVEVNGISLVGVSQKLAAQTLSNCAICPETGTVHFVLARPPGSETEKEKDVMKTGEEKDVIEKKDVTSPSTAPIRPEDGGDNDETSVTPGEGRSEAPSKRSKSFPQTPDTFLKARAEPEFVGRDAVRLTKEAEGERSGDKSELVSWKMERLKTLLRMSKLAVMATSLVLVSSALCITATSNKSNVV